MNIMGDNIHTNAWYQLMASNKAMYPIITEGCAFNFLTENTVINTNADAVMDSPAQQA